MRSSSLSLLALFSACTTTSTFTSADEPDDRQRPLRSMKTEEALADFDQLTQSIRGLYAPETTMGGGANVEYDWI